MPTMALKCNFNRWYPYYDRPYKVDPTQRYTYGIAGYLPLKQVSYSDLQMDQNKIHVKVGVSGFGPECQLKGTLEPEISILQAH